MRTMNRGKLIDLGLFSRLGDKLRARMGSVQRRVRRLWDKL